MPEATTRTIPAFGLYWPGKEEAAAQASSPCRPEALEVLSGTGSPFTHGNTISEADNLDALKHMVHHGVKADVIYIDPPYNTGKDFVYRDNYRKRREQRASDFGQWHADWLSMMLPRLILAREVLAKTGVIFVSIGEDECAHLRLVMNEVFGEDCFAGQFVWKKGGTGKNDSKFAVVEHEYVLCYVRSQDSPGFNLDEFAHTSTKYNHSDEKGNYSLVRLDSKTLGYLPTLDFPITGPDGKQYLPHQPAGKEKVARWRWGTDMVAERYEELVFSRGFVYTKNYEKKGARPRSLLDGERFGVTRAGRRDAEEALGHKGVFEFPKPVRLISHLIAIAGPADAVVLDFFAGSGTTAQAVLELNHADGGTRRFHLVQLPQPTAANSAAAKAGFATVADICVARVNAVEKGCFSHLRIPAAH
ncbi:site-specific DNA-methyltransferase [Corynebacterium sp.]|uniref:site-specific DNA-methyltransferase n=1 Tax=Corynebacterium sp. TaxID=1720 RepID=UPI0026DBEABB|nr:site-specific DNA-methyltransferase [Corynebacterium sp.]MDO5031627.1 site-specific DNA-methyltransferase [Corynebacterium sp.]